MNKKVTPPVDIDKLIAECKKALVYYPEGVHAEKVKKQIEELEKRK